MEKLYDTKKLLSKLRQPLELNFICNNILNVDEFEVKKYLTKLIEEGIIVEENNYYSIRNNKQ
jgi:hypothetical protein